MPPDIVLTNDEYEILIEVKTSDSVLTENQPVTYLQHLYEAGDKKKFLIFLVPYNYAHQHIWSSKSNEFRNRNGLTNIQTQIVYWNDLTHAIQKSELYLVSEKVKDFYDLLKMWFEVKTIEFTKSEVSYMLKPEIPNILNKLFEIVNEVMNYCSKDFKGKITSDDVEYSVYFKNEKKDYIMSFGIWYDFWNENGSPLCYGVNSDWVTNGNIKFINSHENLIEKDEYFMKVIPENMLMSKKCTEEIAQLIYNELVALTNDVT